MIKKATAKNYIMNAIWDYILKYDNAEEGGIDYFLIEESASKLVKEYVPDWDEQPDLLPYWACIFEWILIHKSSLVGNDDFNTIEVRYRDAIASLKEIGDRRNNKIKDISVVKKMFLTGKSKYHKWVDFL